MKLIQASHVSEERLEQFLENNHQIDIKSLLETGYVVEYDEKIIGCFELASIDNGAYWLKQLYIIRTEAVKLPVLLEFILVFAKQREAKVIYAHSEQPVTDLLLESLSFSLRPEKSLQFTDVTNRKGHWWSYEVC
ncbi:hypothetical protein ACFSKI_05650 [Pseudogracilibacillus auburnensis]|uniref:N-acetyltransferase domain-containing protein n=1 Tax=Pseudogracilibacillus auburnensis TaxID=1494959 RepID=A0A2V3VZB7_9BACI|nr:hypothetical protein [Pseudogracilibacillus auburnensis]MBO1002063.1 hypothetical protein [Pseudogracilibacillus auburnensis]PXW87387.1 hypothetical protein DFR56_10525 [Pseudogracilibacillus auburnensis]